MNSMTSMTTSDAVVGATIAALADGAPLADELGAVDPSDGITHSAKVAAARGDLRAALSSLVAVGLPADLVAPLELRPTAARALMAVPASAPPSLASLRAALVLLLATLVVQRSASAMVTEFIQPVFDKMTLDLGVERGGIQTLLDVLPLVSVVTSVTLIGAAALLFAPGLLQKVLARFLPDLARARRLRLLAVLLDAGAPVTNASAAATVAADGVVPHAEALRAAATAADLGSERALRRVTRAVTVGGVALAFVSAALVAAAMYGQVFLLGEMS